MTVSCLIISHTGTPPWNHTVYQHQYVIVFEALLSNPTNMTINALLLKNKKNKKKTGRHFLSLREMYLLYGEMYKSLTIFSSGAPISSMNYHATAEDVNTLILI